MKPCLLKRNRTTRSLCFACSLVFVFALISVNANGNDAVKTFLFESAGGNLALANASDGGDDAAMPGDGIFVEMPDNAVEDETADEVVAAPLDIPSPSLEQTPAPASSPPAVPAASPDTTSVSGKKSTLASSPSLAPSPSPATTPTPVNNSAPASTSAPTPTSSPPPASPSAPASLPTPPPTPAPASANDAATPSIPPATKPSAPPNSSPENEKKDAKEKPRSSYPGMGEPPLWNPQQSEKLTPTDLVGPFILVEESLPQFLTLFEKISGKIILRTHSLPGIKINFNSPKKLTRAEAITALESLLALSGVNIVPVEGTPFYKVTTSDASSVEAPPLYTDAASVAKLAPSERSITRLYVLQHTPVASAIAVLSGLINKTRGDSVTPVPTANAILFTSSINNIQRAEKIISQFDLPGAVILYKLKHLRASELKKQIQSLRGGPNSIQNILGGDVTVEADDLSNQLLVVTLPANREKIKKLIEQLDKSDVTLKFHTVHFLRASEIKKILLSLSATTPSAGGGASSGGEEGGGRSGAAKPPVVSSAPARNALRNILVGDFVVESDDFANQLLVITQPENHPLVEDLIKRLDKKNSTLVFYEIKHLRATDIKKLIQALQGEAASGSSGRSGSSSSSGGSASTSRSALVGELLLEADNLANRLMVVTSAANHEKVGEIIKQMDCNNMTLEFYDAKHLPASDIKKLIEALRNSSSASAAAAGRVDEETARRAAAANPDHLRSLLGGEFIIAADDLANRLMVLAQPENHKKIREIIEKMDQNKTQLKFYDIKFLSASYVQKLIQKLKTGGDQSGSSGGYSSYYGYSRNNSSGDAFRNLLGGDFIIEANDLANRLMVLAQPEIQAKIQEIIREMDQNTTKLMVFKIKHLKASKIKKLIDTIRNGQGKSAGDDDDYYYSYRRRPQTQDNSRSLLGGEVTIEADDYANQLLVMAPPQIREKITDLIEQLDRDNIPQTVSEVIGLKHSEMENTIRTLATIVTKKGSAAVQVDGGATNTRANNTSRPAGINAVTTSINSYRTFSFINRSNETLPKEEDRWMYRYFGTNPEGDSASNPNSFSEYVTVSGDERTNRMIVFGTPGDIAQIKEIIAKLDTPLPQVRIEAVVVEVTLANGEASGLDTLGLGYRAVASAGNISAPDYNFNASTPVLPGSSAPPFSVSGSLRDFSLSVVFGQAERNSRVRILSAPLISTSHNQPATIFVGEEHPVVTSSLSDLSNTSSTRSTIEFKQIGLSLGVTPRVGANGSVEMKVDQSNQSISRTVSVDGNEQPVTANRSASSYLLANDNETIVLAGLQSYHELEAKGVMWLLGYIPFLGELFRPETKDATRTEIIIFLKPHILGAPDSGDVNQLPGMRPGSLTRPDAQSYINTGRFSAVSLTAEEREAIEEIRRRQEAEAQATRNTQEKAQETARKK